MKYKILLLMLLVMLPIAFATDFTGYPFQSITGQSDEYGITGTASWIDGYALRSSFVDTDLNIGDGSFGFCSIAAGGTEYNPMPVNTDFNYDGVSLDYQHVSIIYNSNESIYQVGSDCTILDTYTITGENYTSNIGFIRGSIEDTNNPTLPVFGIIKYNIAENKTYMDILTLNDETSKLENVSSIQLFDGYVSKDDTYGVVGGYYSSDYASGDEDNAVFGFYDNDNEIFYTVAYSGTSWVKRIEYSHTIYGLDNAPNQEVIFFDDYDADGWNEFIMIGYFTGSYFGKDTARIIMQSIQPLENSPYYLPADLNSYDVYENANANVAVSDPTDTQSLYPCQIGGDSTALEICGHLNIRVSSTSNSDVSYQELGFIINNDFSDALVSSYFVDGVASRGGAALFSYKYQQDNYVCVPRVGLDQYKCYNNVSSPRYTFNLTSNLNNVYSMESYLTELNGDLDNVELLFSNGTIESLDFTDETATYVDDIFPTFDDTNTGRIFTFDMNYDGSYELIYYDDDDFRIYSMNSELFLLQNFTNATTTPTTTTTDDAISGNTQVDPDNLIPDIFELLQNNIQTIFGLILILMLPVMLAGYGIRNPIVLVLAGIVGSVISVILGLISTGVLVLMLISLVILVFAGMYLLKGEN